MGYSVTAGRLRTPHKQQDIIHVAAGVPRGSLLSGQVMIYAFTKHITGTRFFFYKKPFYKKLVLKMPKC